MKRIFNSLLLIFVLPFRNFKKIFKDNFLSGLILGAVFSLLVNVLSMQLQGRIEKQRVLEAIEQEIVSNLLTANNTMTSNNNEVEKKKGVNYFHFLRHYSRDIWEQSTEPLKYVAQLDPNVQSKINIYYTLTIPYVNQMQDKGNMLADKLYSDCALDFDHKKLGEAKHKECDDWYYWQLDSETTGTCKTISNVSFELLKIFHPTKDRLENPILRLLMGTNSMRILSGE